MSLAERFWSKVDKTQDCWLWIGYRTPRGYGRFMVDGKVKNAHVVSFGLLGKVQPKGLFVLHHCDNPPCVRGEHLYAGTKSDNTNDAIKRGRYHKWVGEKSPASKLSDLQVKELRSLYARGEHNYYVLAATFKISKSHVWNIISGRMRKDIL